MNIDLALGEARFEFKDRMTRSQARDFVMAAHRCRAYNIQVASDRRSASLFASPSQLEQVIQEIEMYCFAAGYGSLSVRFEDVHPASFYQLVFHLSPKPSGKALEELTEKAREVQGVKGPLWLFPNPHVESGCQFVEVNFDRNQSDDDLASSKEAVIAVLGPPFDLRLIH